MDDPVQEGVLQFPCEFPIKVIGWNHENFQTEVINILVKHVPELDPGSISSRLSSGSKYRSLSASFTAQDRTQVDALYIDLTAHKLVLWVV